VQTSIETLAHLHYWSIQRTRAASKEEVFDAFHSLADSVDRHRRRLGVALTLKELMSDRGRSHDNLSEVVLWADMLRVQGDKVFYAYMVDNQAIVIRETINANRALTWIVKNTIQSIAKTDHALGIEQELI
jgi:glyceraldehyde-3-phosphate dehydrogenase (NAD(P))